VFRKRRKNPEFQMAANLEVCANHPRCSLRPGPRSVQAEDGLYHVSRCVLTVSSFWTRKTVGLPTAVGTYTGRTLQPLEPWRTPRTPPPRCARRWYYVPG